MNDEQKAKVEEINRRRVAGEKLDAICLELGIHNTTYYQWNKLLENPYRSLGKRALYGPRKVSKAVSHQVIHVREENPKLAKAKLLLQMLTEEIEKLSNE